MCEHNNNNKDSSSTTNNTNKHEDNSFTSSSASSISSHSSSGNLNSKQGTTNASSTTSPSKRYTHNPYAFRMNNTKNNNNSTQQAERKKQRVDTSNNKSPAEIELQRGIDSMLITPDAAQNFHDSNSTLHRSLIGNVSFVPYPSEAVEFNFGYYELTCNSTAQFTRVFIGQLPYRVTEMQLQWIFYVFGHGTRIHDPERITKKAKTIGNARVPTGCIHCHIREDKVKGVLECMHKRLLIDDSGIWYARSEQEQNLLEAYITKLKKHPELRFPDRPYDTMVVQEAVSSYQSSQPRWVSNAPEAEKFAETTPSRKAQILYLQQQKMIKMQQKQQQQQQPSSYPAASALASSSIGSLNNINNNSYSSSTSSHPSSEVDYAGVPAAVSNNSYNHHYNHHRQQQLQQQQKQQLYHHNNNDSYITASYHQQPQQPLVITNNSYINNNTYQR